MKRTFLACILMVMPSFSSADTLPVIADAMFTFNGQEFTISHVSTLDPSTIPALTLTPATCASPCLSSMIVRPNVPTLSELDVIHFLTTQMESGGSLLIDARLPADRALGFIPASVNIPTPTLAPSNPYRDEILMALGAVQFQGVFSFADVTSHVAFDADSATQDASALMIDLLAAGYPPEKIADYLGGMLVWSTLGLSIATATQ